MEHTDSEYAYLFCTESSTMIRLDLMMVCSKWRHQDTGIGIEDIDDDEMWDLSDKVIELLDGSDKRWTIEEIKELVADEDG